jgi:hypothetical protein
MWPYFSLLAIPLFFSLSERSRYSSVKGSVCFVAPFFFLVAIFSGFRYEVGSDWGSYLRILDFAYGRGIVDSLQRSEPSYMLLNWFAANVVGGIVLVNVACAAIACYCLYKFCKRQARPWLATFIVVSYVAIVLVMGVTRQGVAVSIIFFALVKLFERKPWKYSFLVIFAATFHVSAIIMLPLFSLAKNNGKFFNIFLAVFVLLGVLVFAYVESYSTLQVHYIDRELHSFGSYFRFLFHLAAAAGFFFLSGRILLNSVEMRVYKVFSYSILVLFIFLFVFPSTTAIDRLAFYLIPLQVVVFTNLPNILYKDNRLSPVVIPFVLLVYWAKLFLWFSMGVTSDRFLPYQMAWFGI